MKLLITVEFSHNKDGWSWDSGIKNEAVDYNPDKETIHDLVKRICKYKGMELTHKGKALGMLFYDYPDGSKHYNGYAYRGKSWSDCPVYGMKPRIVYWSIFVKIARIVPFNLEKDSVRKKEPIIKALKAA
jgi:hypothetical protein